MRVAKKTATNGKKFAKIAILSISKFLLFEYL